MFKTKFKSELAEALSRAALQEFFKSSGFHDMNLATRKKVVHRVMNELKNSNYEISLMERIVPQTMFVIDDSSYVEVNRKYVVSIRK